MKIKVMRDPSYNGATIGWLYVDDRPFCYTLEDEIREKEGVPVAQWKVPGGTAIPCGTYSLVLDFSKRFGRIMPHILDVPGFTGIRLHPGNTTKDTEGCLLVGMDTRGSIVTESKKAFQLLFDVLQNAKDAITIEIA